jgi:hypothetical protein
VSRPAREFGKENNLERKKTIWKGKKPFGKENNLERKTIWKGKRFGKENDLERKTIWKGKRFGKEKQVEVAQMLRHAYASILRFGDLSSDSVVYVPPAKPWAASATDP